MPRERSANWKKRQAERLFDDFISIKRRSGSLTKHRGSPFEGDDVVSDARTRLSGTFSRETKLLQSRALEEECSEKFIAQGAVNTEGPEQGPSEDDIHKAALKLTEVADDFDGSYDMKGTQQKLIDKLNEKGSNLPYEVFEKVVSEVLPQDRDAHTFHFVLQVSSLVICQLKWSFQSHFKKFVSEQFADEAVTCIEQQSDE